MKSPIFEPVYGKARIAELERQAAETNDPDAQAVLLAKASVLRTEAFKKAKDAAKGGSKGGQEAIDAAIKKAWQAEKKRLGAEPTHKHVRKWLEKYTSENPLEIGGVDVYVDGGVLYQDPKNGSHPLNLSTSLPSKLSKLKLRRSN